MTILTEAHRRFNPLRNSWVLCSPHRTQRPWQGQQEQPQIEDRPEYDDKCYLCPRNTRAQGQANLDYTETFVFTNDFSAVRPRADLGLQEEEEKEESADGEDDLFKAEQTTGKCVVMCFNPRHDLTLARMNQTQIEAVVRTWAEVFQGAVEDPEIAYCQIFENKGAAMGCSNPHPHGQAWMTSSVPEEPQIEHDCMVAYKKKHGRGLLEDYVRKELAVHDKAVGNDSVAVAQNRVVELNDSFVAVVPFWATWPFEILVVSRRKVGNVAQLSKAEQADLANILRLVALRYDNLFECSFPYSMGLHQSFTSTPPSQDEVEHLHIHFYPPLLRSATVRKFLVGFEMLGMPQRDLTPESAAARLRAVDSTTHYMTKLGH